MFIKAIHQTAVCQVLSLQNNLLQHTASGKPPMYKHRLPYLGGPFLSPCLADLLYQIFQILDLLGQGICPLFQSLILLF